MGFKVRKTYKTKGWLPVNEDTIDKIADSIDELPTYLVYPDIDCALHDVKVRRVEATVTIEVKEISK